MCTEPCAPFGRSRPLWQPALPTSMYCRVPTKLFIIVYAASMREEASRQPSIKEAPETLVVPMQPQVILQECVNFVNTIWMVKIPSRDSQTYLDASSPEFLSNSPCRRHHVWENYSRESWDDLIAALAFMSCDNPPNPLPAAAKSRVSTKHSGPKGRRRPTGYCTQKKLL